MTAFATHTFGLHGHDTLEITDYRSHNMGFAAKFTFREDSGSRLGIREVGHTPFEVVAKMAGNKEVRRHLFPLLRLARHYQRAMKTRDLRAVA